ncbi:MAG: 1-acyl-sn-glycerol-3-phosphate acyltransferase [Candidatus Omnitrophica bacterium]|nr:1-acyl-sn-glycerol-3-phosphate acyltransferase [Candidatus Omnitrophota bacterium]
MTGALTEIFKDFIMLNSGEKIYPEEIEAAYIKVAPIKEMCVFTVSGMRGVRESNFLWAVIQPDLDNFREFNEVNLRFVLQERFDNASKLLPFYKRIKGFTIALEDMPHNLFGKLQRRAVKAIYEPRVIAGLEGALPVLGKLSADDLLLTKSEDGKKILGCLKSHSDLSRPIILEDSLELDLGIDSLGRIELALCLELAFGADIKDEAISRAFSVKDLILEITDALKTAKVISSEDQGISLGPDFWKESLRVPPKKENLEMLELSAGYFAWLFRFILTAINCLILKLFFSVKEEGAKNVPEEGAYILYANHTSFLDGPAINACLPRRPVFQIFYFVFGPYFFRPFLKFRVLRNLLKMGRVISFDYSTHFLESLRSCYFVLQHGKGLCYFPEGVRSSDGKIGEFKKGLGVLAKVTGAKLVPVAIEGAHEAWASTEKYPRFRPIRVRFGTPFLPEDLEKEGLAMGAQNSYEAICVAARKALIELKNK